jgi:mRNA interferase RelE/StbE
MASYRVVLKPSVHKDLRSLPRSLVARVMGHIEGLTTEPIPRQPAKLSGAERMYRVRVGNYHIVYEIDIRLRQVVVH